MPRPRRNFKVDEERLFFLCIYELCIDVLEVVSSRIENVAVYKMFTLFLLDCVFMRGVYR